RAQQRGTLHVVALLSDARVHGDLRHLFALLQFAKREQLKQVAVHAILDGRDTAAVLGLPLLRRVGAFCEDLGVGRIETVQGRFYAMDRDLQWARTQRAYEAIV